MTTYKSSQSYTSLAFLKRNIAVVLASGMVAFVGVVDLPNRDSDNLSKHLIGATQQDLASGHSRAIAFLHQYKDEIIGYWLKYRIVPPEMLATTILQENRKRPGYEDLADFLGIGETAKFWDTYIVPSTKYLSFFGYKPRFFCGTDTSLGPGQIQISRARRLSRKYGIGERFRAELENILQDPVENIRYLHLDLADLMARKNRQPQNGASFFDDPKLAGVIYTEHKMGQTSSPIENAQPSEEGREFIKLLVETDFSSLFGTHTTLKEEQKEAMKKFLQRKTAVAKPKKQRIKPRC
ncbi:hypothetical protein HYY71_01725 [Candidatus Woesearchaeota archaeon]|nr:hypothetical protein [Candidatus Woesearchaeota archaeon]